jgi:hypothetical protein
MRTAPMAAASADAEPEIPANSMLVKMFTCASPPLKCPISALERFTNLRVIPPVFMIWPARIKKGTAIMGNELRLKKSFCGTISKDMSPIPMIAMIPANSIQKATGIPKNRKTKKIPSIK